MKQTIILVHYINTKGKSEEESVQQYHDKMYRLAKAQQHENQQNVNIMHYVMLSETKPTSIECVYPTVQLTDKEDYNRLIEALDKLTNIDLTVSNESLDDKFINSAKLNVTMGPAKSLSNDLITVKAMSEPDPSLLHMINVHLSTKFAWLPTKCVDTGWEWLCTIMVSKSKDKTEFHKGRPVSPMIKGHYHSLFNGTSYKQIIKKLNNC